MQAILSLFNDSHRIASYTGGCITPPNDSVVDVQDAGFRLVGREAEQTRLATLLGGAIRGEGSLVLVGGEAGIGKTSLVEAVARPGRSQGAMVLQGNCYDLAATPPYGPWREMLAAYQPAERMPAAPAAFLDQEAFESLDSQQDLFVRFTRFLNEAAAGRPLVILLEDLHWADQASIELLRFSFRRVSDLPILVLATYRDDELTRSTPLYQLLPVIVRETQAVRLRLDRLDLEATTALVHASYELNEPDSGRLARFVQRLSEGNPFFIVELLSRLEEDGVLHRSGDGWRFTGLDSDGATAPVPQLVRQVIDGRVRQLGEDARRLLEVAAVIGQNVPLDLWREMTGEPKATFYDVIERALEARLLVEPTGAQTLRFSHALVREALYGDVILPRRRALHCRAGEILSDGPAPDPETVAYHFRQAADERAIEWLTRAGERARSVYALDAAIQNFSDAIHVSRQLSENPPLRALRGRGLAYSTVGEFDRARADLSLALNHARAREDTGATWQLLTDLGVLWAERDYTRTSDYFRDALDLARELGDESVLAHSLNWIGNWRLNVDQPDEARRLHDEALAVFQRINDVRGIASTFDLLGMAYIIGGDMVSAANRYQQAIDLFRELDDRRGVISPLANTGLVYGSLGSVEVPAGRPVVEKTGEAFEMATEIEWRAGQSYSSTVLCASLGWTGEYGRAIEAGKRALDIAREIEHHEWVVFATGILGALYVDLLDDDMAHRYLEQSFTLSGEIGSLLHQRIVAGYLIQAHILAGDIEQGQRVFEMNIDPDADPRTIGERLCWFARAELERAKGDPERALQIIDRLIASARNWSHGMRQPQLLSARGEALLELGRLDEARDSLEGARRSATDSGHRPLFWRADVALARCALTEGNRTAAGQFTETARAIIDELAGSFADDDHRDAYRQRAMAALVENGSLDRLPEQQPDTGGLTPRQYEIAALIAAGRTNLEIADELHISARTVEGHVTNILATLELASRTQIAAWAVRQGLTSTVEG